MHHCRLLFIVAATSVAAQTFTLSGSDVTASQLTITPTARPASSPTAPGSDYTPDVYDSWHCATKNISAYLQPPMPTGHLLDVYYDYSDKIYAECEAKIPKPFTTFPACPSIAKASWCALSTAVPSSDMNEYRAYTSSLSSWWSSHSSMISELRSECPYTWSETTKDLPGSEIWLNATNALVECNVENKTQPSASPASPASPVRTSATSATASGAGSECSISHLKTIGAGLFAIILML